MTYKIDLGEMFNFDKHESFRKEVDEALAAGHRHITLDFSRVEFIDSAALGMLMVAHKSAAHHNATIELLRVNGVITEILTLTQVGQLFKIV